MGFMPVFTTKDERLAFTNSQPQLFEKFNDWVNDNAKRHNAMIEKMKLYILDNYERVDLSDVGIKINKTTYGKKYNVNGDRNSTLDRILSKMNKNIEEITSIKFTYDYHDSDFYVKINDKSKKLLDDEIADIAVYIELKLTNNE